MSPNVQAYLDLIAWAEGTSTVAGSDDGYDVLVRGTLKNPSDAARVRELAGPDHLFMGYNDHPNIDVIVNSSGLRSDAAGRYQQMHRDWPVYKARLGLRDFGPDAQDALAVQHIRECRALDLVEAGNIPQAITQCANIWASFPGNAYGQRQHHIDDLLDQFVQFGGALA